MELFDIHRYTTDYEYRKKVKTDYLYYNSGIDVNKDNTIILNKKAYWKCHNRINNILLSLEKIKKGKLTKKKYLMRNSYETEEIIKKCKKMDLHFYLIVSEDTFFKNYKPCILAGNCSQCAFDRNERIINNEEIDVDNGYISDDQGSFIEFREINKTPHRYLIISNYKLNEGDKKLNI